MKGRLLMGGLYGREARKVQERGDLAA